MNLNTRIFFKINQFLGKSSVLDAFGRAGAEWAIIASLGWFITTIFVVLDPDWKLAILYSGFFGICILVTWGLNTVIGKIVKQPRPYIIYPQTKVLLNPRPIFSNKTFPSDHTTFAFLIFFVAVFLGLPWTFGLMGLALWVGWGRLYAGVHYPSDIFGGIFIAACMSYVIKWWGIPLFHLLISFI